LSFLKGLNQLLGLPSLLLIGCRGLLPLSVKLTIRLHVLLRLRIRGAVPQLPHVFTALTGTALYRVSHYLPNPAFFFNNSKTNEDIATKQTHTADTFLFISHTTNILLFKSHCNIFIGFRIIKEMPGLVGSGTPCNTSMVK